MRSLLVSLLLAASTTVALAQQPPVVVVPRPTVNQLELNNLRNAQTRQVEQFRQDLNRQQDRQMNMRPAPRPDVPVIRAPCVTATGLPRSC